jgi:hypothetical protein
VGKHLEVRNIAKKKRLIYQKKECNAFQVILAKTYCTVYGKVSEVLHQNK